MDSDTEKDLARTVGTFMFGMSTGAAIMLCVCLASKGAIKEQGRNQAYAEARNLGLGDWEVSFPVDDTGVASKRVSWKWSVDCAKGK